MLTKDLLRFSRNRQSRIFPRFLNVDNKAALLLAEELGDIYKTGIESSREELAELTHPVINGYRSPLIAKGINKLLLDRCEFQEPDSAVEPFRTGVFATAAELLKSADAKMDSLTHFRNTVGKRHDMDADDLAAALHGDLPIRQPLLQFKEITSERLLHRYNLAQAQGLLYNSSHMTLTFNEPDVGRRRFFFRYLKFFRLMARIYKEGAGRYRLELDGPLSLFDQTRKYGLQMANLLPVIVLLSQWSVTAKVKPEERSGVMELDQNSGLVSHYSVTTAHIPGEFTSFAEQFRREVKEWKIVKNSPLLDLGRQEVAIPDFSFRHKSGQVVHLELFHRWHKGPLEKRLKHLETGRTKTALLIGVDRFLTKDPALQKKLEHSGWYQKHGMPFNAFPPVKRVVKCLEGFLEG